MTAHPPDAIVHIIDDDAAVRDALSILLGVHGLTTRAYASAEAFLAAAALRPGDCLLTDVQMPQMGGLELLARLRARGERLPLVVMTGRVEAAVAAEARAQGATFVEKPFRPAEILQAVRAALGRAGS